MHTPETAETQATFSTRTAATLYSGILATGSRAGFVSTLAAASAKWKGINTMPGGTRRVIQARVSISPRRLTTRTRSDLPRPSRSAFFQAGISSHSNWSLLIRISKLSYPALTSPLSGITTRSAR